MSFYSALVDPVLKEIRIRIPDFSAMKKGDKVLDICCGTGDQAFHYKKRDIVAVGIDLNPKMIETAEKRKERERVKDVFFLSANAANLPFEDNFFDFASISLALHEITRHMRDEIVSEMKRVVKEDGHLVFIDFSVPLPKKFNSFLVQSVEFLAGRKNFHNFKDYYDQGGLPFILKKNEQEEEKIEYLGRGLITVIKAKNSKN
ncbi:MAG: methyltransferase domain-containing protein [Parcubacteria group bacterium]|nr:MAG: methyltransferase domain-containing protein [Parcubacteria group bacterium]